MRNFIDTSASSIEEDPRLILKFEEFVVELGRSRFHYILRDEGHLIIAGKSFQPLHNNTPGKWLAGTDLEIPAAGLQWFISTLEKQFFKTATEGGLPKDQFSYDELVDGEHLSVSRMFGTPGYGFKNYSRKSYIYQELGIDAPQQADLSDELLFEKGLFEKFKEVANQLALSSTKP